MAYFKDLFKDFDKNRSQFYVKGLLNGKKGFLIKIAWEGFT